MVDDKFFRVELHADPYKHIRSRCEMMSATPKQPFSKQQMPVCEASMTNAKTSQFDISSSHWKKIETFKMIPPDKSFLFCSKYDVIMSGASYQAELKQRNRRRLVPRDGH
ncbi:hypothetical protein TNCV_53291 [Trichonephila clavipes]|nr:hypothetical protein TNCV_53291 [Trichonephila clavipes]